MEYVDYRIFDFVYEMAMRDATMRTAFSGDRKNIRQNLQAKNAMHRYIDNILYGNEAIRKNFEKCHCPMDSVMIKNAVSFYSQKKDDKVCGDAKGVKKALANVSWSRLTRDQGNAPYQYELFQKVIANLAKEDDMTPLEYDYYAWNTDNYIFE